MRDFTTNELLTQLVHSQRVSRRWRWSCVALLCMLCCGSPFARTDRRAEGAPASVSSEPAEDAEAIVKARLALARKALAIIRAKTALGPQVSHPVEDTYRWSVLQLGTQIYLSMRPGEPRVEDPEVYLAVPDVRPNPDRLKAFEVHYALMRKWEDRLRPLAENTLIAPLDFMEIQEHRLQAELWVARERAKSEEANPE